MRAAGATPRDVLAFANIPIDVEHERYIFSGQVPGPIAGDIVQSGGGIVPQTFSHRMMAQEPIVAEGGWVRITDSTNFPAATTIAAALVNIEPGAMRELHSVPIAPSAIEKRTSGFEQLGFLTPVHSDRLI